MRTSATYRSGRRGVGGGFDSLHPLQFLGIQSLVTISGGFLAWIATGVHTHLHRLIVASVAGIGISQEPLVLDSP